MQFNEAAKALQGIPYTSPAKGRIFYDWVLEKQPKRILELGFAHGVSTCYLAAAAQEIGNCVIDAVDLKPGLKDPTIEEVSARLGFTEIIRTHRMDSSYTWYLKQMIEAQSAEGICSPAYDLCFIDGPKDWTNDGCAFFLVNKLLKDGGFIAFDDYAWTYRDHERKTGKTFSKGYVFDNLSEQELSDPQVKSVFELLVMQHPEYSEFEIIDDNIACAKKISTSGPKSLSITTKVSLRYKLKAAFRRVMAK